MFISTQLFISLRSVLMCFRMISTVKSDIYFFKYRYWLVLTAYVYCILFELETELPYLVQVEYSPQRVKSRYIYFNLLKTKRRPL